MNREDIGTFRVESGEIIVSDPCYEKPEEMANSTLNGRLKAKNGRWMAATHISDEGDWGHRVAYQICYHEDHPVDYQSVGLESVSFQVAVDSGQAGVFDAERFKDDTSVEGVAREGHSPIREDEPFYSMCCDRTLSDAPGHGGVIPYGAISSSGFGDGCYKCEVLKKDDEVVGVVINFGLDEDEGEDDPDYLEDEDGYEEYEEYED